MGKGKKGSGKMRSGVCALAIVVGFCASVTPAARIDFELFPQDSNLPSYTEQGVTFRPVGAGGSLRVWTGGSSPNGTAAMVEESTPDRYEVRADIAGGAGTVSVDLGDLNQDPDRLFLEAFNAAGTRVGYAEELIDPSFIGMRTLSLSAPDIAYVVFGGRPPSGGGSTVFSDNFTYEVVPEPAALVPVVVAAAGLALRRRTVSS
jgi:hypothetical protein